MDLTDITDTEMQTGMKGMKKKRAPGIDEMRVEMVAAAGGEKSAAQASEYMYEAR